MASKRIILRPFPGTVCPAAIYVFVISSYLQIFVALGGESRQGGILLKDNEYSFRNIIQTGTCKSKDISISQMQEGTSGIPQFAVQIFVACMPTCAPWDIHVSCGAFASAQAVNPNVFQRLAYDDCLVNAGRPLRAGQIIRFTYQNSYMYPMKFKYARFC